MRAGQVPGFRASGSPGPRVPELRERSGRKLLRPLLSDSERDDDVCLLLCHLRGPA
ncbi:hypothetical protein [Streptomyces parvulus]